MPVNDRRKAQLRLIIDDPAIPNKKDEATRALQELSSDQPQSPRRPGRNSNIRRPRTTKTTTSSGSELSPYRWLYRLRLL